MKSKIKFESALLRLEEIVQSLENGVDELDKIVDLFHNKFKTLNPMHANEIVFSLLFTEGIVKIRFFKKSLFLHPT